VVALLPALPTVHPASVLFSIWARSRAVPTSCTMRADFVIYAAVLCYVLVTLTLITVTDCYIIPGFAYISGYEHCS
jgi:hypothetical protein